MNDEGQTQLKGRGRWVFITLCRLLHMANHSSLPPPDPSLAGSIRVKPRAKPTGRSLRMTLAS